VTDFPRGPDTQALARLLNERFTCRAFRSESVADPVIADILEIAQRTPSWCNAQPWQVIVTRGAGSERFREALYRHASDHQAAPDFPHPREYKGVYQQRRRECGLQLYASLGITRDTPDAAKAQGMENFRMFGAPHAAIITTDEALGVYGAIDCGAYLSNFLLAAQSHGVAAAPQAALASHADFVRAHFGLGDDRRVVCGVSFGYAEKDHPINLYRTSRASIDQSVTWVDE
jgi:nitroreductase